MSTPKEKSEYITLSIPVSAIKCIVLAGFTAWGVWILFQMVKIIPTIPSK
jgi:hypothetical protein